MSEVEGVQGGGGSEKYSKEELQKYQQDYEKGLDLFKASFKEYTQPDVEVHKKKQLKKVMDEALQVMNETARVSLREGKLGSEKQLNTDYHTFLQNPTAENQKKVAQDLKALSE